MEDFTFPIGTQFRTRGKYPRVATVVDILKTYNANEELVWIRYVSEHNLMGQTVRNCDVIGTTIAKNIIE